MKKILLALFLVAVLGPAAAQATDYGATCSGSACLPFNPSNATLQSLALSTATANNAAVGSTIYVAYFPPQPNHCFEKDIEWVVNHSPVRSIADLTFDEIYCDVNGM